MPSPYHKSGRCQWECRVGLTTTVRVEGCGSRKGRVGTACQPSCIEVGARLRRVRSPSDMRTSYLLPWVGSGRRHDLTASGRGATTSRPFACQIPGPRFPFASCLSGRDSTTCCPNCPSRAPLAGRGKAGPCPPIRTRARRSHAPTYFSIYLCTFAQAEGRFARLHGIFPLVPVSPCNRVPSLLRCASLPETMPTQRSRSDRPPFNQSTIQRFNPPPSVL